MIHLINSIAKIWLPKILFVTCCSIFCLGVFLASPATASIVSEPVTEVKVSLGSNANELKFFPNKLKFIADRYYKLIIDNPSPQKHYFTAKDFADAIWTSKVEDDKVEVKGAIHEVELQPGAELAWVFVPLKTGTYSLHCPITGHTEAGMTGEIIVSAE